MSTLATPVPPIKKVPSEPGCYRREKQKAAWYYWVVPSRHDPKNALLANWAPWVAAVEWVAFVGFIVVYPNVCGPAAPSYSMLMLVPGIFGMLACWGYRGKIAGHERRMASSILFYTNAPLFLLFELSLLKVWWDDR